MSRTNHHRRASSVSSLSCSSFDTNEEEYMASEKNWFATRNVVPLPTPINNGQRMQTEMTILACSSPEIQALHKAYNGPCATKNRVRNQLSGNFIPHGIPRPTSPTSSITSYSSISKSDAVLILSSLDQISRCENDATLISHNLHALEHSQPAYSQYRQEHNIPRSMLPPTQSSTRNSLVFRTHEIASQTSYRSLELPFATHPEALNRSSSDRLFPQTSLRKPSFHRRVSHDSLPSPTEIASLPPVVAPPSSTRLYHGRNHARIVHPSNLHDYPKHAC